MLSSASSARSINLQHLPVSLIPSATVSKHCLTYCGDDRCNCERRNSHFSIPRSRGNSPLHGTPLDENGGILFTPPQTELTRKPWYYICHPFTTYGDPDANMALQKQICQRYPFESCVPISPIITFGSVFPRDLAYHGVAMEACMRLLNNCDACHVYGDWQKSTGCQAEVKMCRERGIPVVFVCNLITLVARAISRISIPDHVTPPGLGLFPANTVHERSGDFCLIHGTNEQSMLEVEFADTSRGLMDPHNVEDIQQNEFWGMLSCYH